MPYVQRSGGKIVATYSNPQEYATEWVEDDSDELKPTIEEIVNFLKAELDALERRGTSLRAIRETFIKLYEFLRPSLGYTPEQLAQLPAYKGFKDLDAIAAAKREEIRNLL